MAKKQTYIIVGLCCLVASIIFSFFFPNNVFSKIVIHFNNNSTIVIMALTLVYVITTNRQLSVMKEQIYVMKDEINLQSQPIPIPNITESHLEKIRPFMGPEDNFMKVIIMSRFFCDIDFKNIGNGAALNVIIFPTITIGKNTIPSPSLRPEASHCISKEIENNNIHIMMFDNGFEIVKGVIEREAFFELNIFYKNIFGQGFHEYIKYSIFTNDNTDIWKEFIDKGYEGYKLKIEKHDALKPIDKNDADAIYSEIKDELNDLFKEDLKTKFDVMPQSYRIKLVDYVSEIQEAEKYNEELFKAKFKNTYESFKRVTANKEIN